MDWLTDINVHVYLIPLVVSISLVYSATRFESWSLIWIHSFRWAVYIATFLGGVYLLLFLVHWLVDPYWIIGLAIVIIAAFTYLSRSKEKAEPEAEKNEKSEKPKA